MRLITFFALGLLAGLICLPLSAAMRERILQAAREFRAGWYGSGGYEARGGGGTLDERANKDDSELVMTIPTPSELFITVRPLP